MLIVLSPAKSLDYESQVKCKTHSLPMFAHEAQQLIDVARGLSVAQIAGLMSISAPLAQLNADRFARWSPDVSTANARQAVYAFNGDVYEGLDAASLKPAQINYLQDRLRILSGLYGLLRPLDLLQPYRLEMGTRLANPRGSSLYAYWGNTITEALNHRIAEAGVDTLVNLASEEYFKAVRPATLKARIVAPVFQDWKNGKYKIISFYAKRARGLMARYCALNHIDRPEHMKSFDLDGYRFDAAESDEVNWVFRRRLEGA
jgi:cytoplasmic iron level regulating protein YaaA (DUF328/UPF0246 family)